MGARCASLEDGASPCQISASCCKCNSCSSSSPATTAATPTSRSSQTRSRTSTNEDIRSAFSPPQEGSEELSSAFSPPPEGAEEPLSAFSPPAAASDQDSPSVALVQQEPVTKAKSSKGDSPKKRASKSEQGSLVQTDSNSPKRRLSASSVPDSEVCDTLSDDGRASDGGRSPIEEEPALRSSIASNRAGNDKQVKELKTFRQFLKPRFGTPGEAYDSLLGLRTKLDEKAFLVRMEELQYTGNAERLFHALSTDGSGTISREAFKEHLVAIARIPQPKRKSISFGAVVLHAVQSIKGVDLEDAWDPTPLDEDTAQMPPIEILIDEAEESKEARPKVAYKDTTQFVEMTNAQPGASGQPATGDQPRLRSYGSQNSAESFPPSEDPRGEGVEKTDSEGAKAKQKSPVGKTAVNAEASRNKKRRDSGPSAGMLSPGRKGVRRSSRGEAGMLSPGRKGARKNSMEKNEMKGGEDSYSLEAAYDDDGKDVCDVAAVGPLMDG